MMKKILFLLLLPFIANTVLAASTWRCQGGLVSKGNSQFDVVDKCGSPNSRNFIGWRRVATGYFGTFTDERVEEWVYIVSNGLFYVLRFEGSKLAEVTSHYTQ